MFPLDYTFEYNGLLYKHTITDNPPCDAFFMHTHNLYELLYFISGDATLIIEDRKYKLQKGDLMFIRPSKYHYIQIDTSERYERYDVLFPGTGLNEEENALIPENLEVISIASNPVADGIFRKMDYYYEGLDAKNFTKVMMLLLKELFFCISIAAEKTERSAFSAVSPMLSEVLKYINDNLFAIKNISEITANFFVTESYLFRLFKSELKRSPKKYITAKRLLAAQSLIAMGEKPTEVYEKCGFNEYTTFYRSYKNFFGYVPSREIYSNTVPFMADHFQKYDIQNDEEREITA
ncbi:MAG: helix-turn-helix transcriptional regulator [Clostridia bacterium]|nr:helix-turn-helix transcriptional regulator [Clostridia bacterium]